MRAAFRQVKGDGLSGCMWARTVGHLSHAGERRFATGWSGTWPKMETFQQEHSPILNTSWFLSLGPLVAKRTGPMAVDKSDRGSTALVPAAKQQNAAGEVQLRELALL